MTASGLIDTELADIFNSKPAPQQVTKKQAKEAPKGSLSTKTQDGNPIKNAVDASWAPVKQKPNPIEILSRCAFIAFLHGAAEMVLFYWGITGLMDYQTSWGASVVIAVIGGFRIGWTLRKGKQDV